MEKLTINIPEAKSYIVKQILHSLGVELPGHKVLVRENYKEKLLQISNWTEEDVSGFDEGLKSFNGFKAHEW